MADRDIVRGDLGFTERWKDFTAFFARIQAAILVSSAGTEIGTASNPLRVDPTGTTGQTVAIDQTTPGTTDSITVKASAGIGSLTETAPATDTASSGLNGRLQRIAQRLTTLIGLVPTALTGSGNFKVAVQEALPTGSNVVGKVGIDQTTPGTTDSVTVATGQGGGATIGTTADAAVVTDTTGTLSGKLRGLVKWAFERMPASLGQTTAANSLPVVLASDQGNLGTVDSAVVTEAAWTTLVNAVVFDDDPTSLNSANMNVDGYRGVWVLLDIDSTATPTDIRFLPQFSDDGGTTYWDYEVGIWASMYFEDQDTASGVKKVFPLPLEGIDDWRIRVVATGTDGTNKFTVTVRARGYR